MAKLMVSFCNVFPRGLATGIFDYGLEDFKWIDLSNVYDYTKITGATGLCTNKNLFTRYWATTQEIPNLSALVALDNSFKALKFYKLARTFDAHSLTPFGNGFLITYTLGNRINKIQIGSDANGLSENEYWRYCDDEQADVVHVNSVCVIDGQVYASIFGEKPKEGWAYARNGKIINISKNKIICDNQFHPHSLLNIDGVLYWLESRASNVHRFSEEKGHEIIITLSGYLRGITYDDKYFYIASSAARRQSRTTGTMNVLPSDPDDMHSWIYRISRENLEVDRQRLTVFGAEIFDLLIVEDPHLKMGTANTDPILKRLWRYDDEYLDLRRISEQLIEWNNKKELLLKQLKQQVKLLTDTTLSNQETITQKDSQIKHLNEKNNAIEITASNLESHKLALENKLAMIENELSEIKASVIFGILRRSVRIIDHLFPPNTSRRKIVRLSRAALLARRK